MKDYIIFSIFLYLYKTRISSAKIISNQFEISQRSVYRYIDALSLAGIPVITKRGRGGGIELLSNFKLDSILLSNADKETIKSFVQNPIINNEIINILKKLI